MSVLAYIDNIRGVQTRTVVPRLNGIKPKALITLCVLCLALGLKTQRNLRR